MPDLEEKKEIKDLIISIVSYNSLNYLRECLDSILKNPPGLDYEIIVIDNASGDGTVESVKKDYPGVTLIPGNKNVGFAAANNRAIEKSDSKYIVLLNSDCMVYKKSLDNLVDFMNKHPGAGITGPKIVNSDGTIQLSCRRFPSLMNAAAHTILADIFPGNPFSKKYKLADIGRDDPSKVDWVSGSCMIIRREALEDTGTLDERYFMYVEDLDICYRMWQKNWEVYYNPEAKIMHHIAGSSGRGKIKSSFRMQRSVFYFFWKNYRKDWRIILIPLLILALGFRLFLSIIKSCFSKKNNIYKS
ncbi:MAG: glycosyltransferase family 2 protein [Actinomycetota bacterium]|nr:glycosyltransferase family 2 protein [Actinomycetota bacterium]